MLTNRDKKTRAVTEDQRRRYNATANAKRRERIATKICATSATHGEATHGRLCGACASKKGAWKESTKEHRKAYGRQWYLKNKTRKRIVTIDSRRRAKDRQRARLYGTTVEAIIVMLHAQGGCCAICLMKIEGVRRQCNVDHDHATGRVRGLLCNRCNLALGLFRDDPELLIAAASYVRNTEVRHAV